MKKIFITGSLGFIGTHLSEHFLKKKFSVIGIDNLSNNYSNKIYKNNLNLLKKHKKYTFYKTNILDKKRVYFLLKKYKPDFIIHCAAKVGVRNSIKKPLEYNNVNVIGTQTLLEGVRLLSPKTKTILISSSSVYGKQKTLPFSENMLPNPISPYGLSKYLMELIAKQYFELFKIKIIVIRAFSVYGPLGRSNMLPFLLINNYLKNKSINLYGTNKNNRRDWTYIEDFIDAISNIINNYRFNSFEIINIGYGQSVGIDDFAKYFILQLNEYVKKNLKVRKTERQKIETSITLSNIDKAKKMIGYFPKVSYKEGITRTIKYFIKNRSLYFDV